LSALASTFGGIVNPICLAAFRLIMNSNFVACSTGRSAGFATFLWANECYCVVCWLRYNGPVFEQAFDMGLFHVKGHLTGPTGRIEEVELLVDTGATLSVVPRSLAERLELKTTRSQRVVIAGGQRDVWPIAEARLALNGDEITTPCFIAPEGPALLGAVALESLFLAVDPVGKRLIPVDGFVG
jgi:aspartyl protease family protein